MTSLGARRSGHGPVGATSFVVAVPVRNESERILGCLEALAGQADVPGSLGILLFMNNCTDGTQRIVAKWAPGSPWPIRIAELNSVCASAGWARRQAMDLGAAWLGESASAGGLLLTTDADSRVPPGWVSDNAAAIAAGADAVAGRVAFDPDEVALLSAGLRRRQRLEVRYEMLLAEIEARLDPRSGNPWPCHWMKSGASIAVTLAAYRRVGGIPMVQSGEDHAFIDLLATHGLVVRHAPDIVVTTSGRLDGRAIGGASATLRSWCGDLDSPCDARLERASVFVSRILRRRIRVDPPPPRHGMSRPLRPRELPRQIRLARLMLSIIRLLGSRPDGRRLFVPGVSPGMPKRLSIS